MCFFVGNDFLPHIPTLSIREGGIDSLMFLYKRYNFMFKNRALPEMRDYLTNEGDLNLFLIDLFLK